MRLQHYLLNIFLLWTPALVSHAEVTEYDIEVLIFEDASGRYIDSEQWPRLEHMLLLDQAKTKADANNIDKAFDKTASTGKHAMGRYVKALNTSGRYNVLAHKSWRQTGLDAESAFNIHISSEKDGENKNTTSSISGGIKIILGRYLHIYTDLIYKKPNASYSTALTSLNNEQYKEFSIRTHRRMRSKELHYLDHPLVGILVMALPVKKPPEKLPEKLPEKPQEEISQ